MQQGGCHEEAIVACRRCRPAGRVNAGRTRPDESRRIRFHAGPSNATLRKRAWPSWSVRLCAGAQVRAPSLRPSSRVHPPSVRQSSRVHPPPVRPSSRVHPPSVRPSSRVYSSPVRITPPVHASPQVRNALMDIAGHDSERCFAARHPPPLHWLRRTLRSPRTMTTRQPPRPVRLYSDGCASKLALDAPFGLLPYL